MNKLYQKSQLWFALTWIVVYVVGTSVADGLSEAVGVAKSLTLILHLVMVLTAVLWLKQTDRFTRYGLCKPAYPAASFLFYVPLIIISSVNLWFGMTLNMSILESCLYVASMICVGFLEELIFRGFLFKAMAKNHVPSAIAVSAITFGIGHMVNLINGSGADLVSNLCQVCHAMAFGWLCVILFYRGGSLWPCIVTHSVVNALSAFSNEQAMSEGINILISGFLCLIAVVYTLILLKTLPTPVIRKEEPYER